MLVLGLDFETNGKDATTVDITEIGAVLYDVMSYGPGGSSLEKISEYNTLVWDKNYPPQSEKIIELTGITDEMLVKDGVAPTIALDALLSIIEKVDIVMAHKISFDRTVWKSNSKKLGLRTPEKEWLCTLTNFNWPKRITCHKLSHIAYEHGIMVDPRTLHRAAQDVELMGRVVNEYDFDKVLEYARTPWIYLRADCAPPWLGRGGDGGIQRDIAKEVGFSYESIKGVDEYQWPKSWVTRVKMYSGDHEKILAHVAASKSPFRVSVIEGLS